MTYLTTNLSPEEINQAVSKILISENYFPRFEKFVEVIKGDRRQQAMAARASEPVKALTEGCACCDGEGIIPSHLLAKHGFDATLKTFCDNCTKVDVYHSGLARIGEIACRKIHKAESTYRQSPEWHVERLKAKVKCANFLKRPEWKWSVFLAAESLGIHAGDLGITEDEQNRFAKKRIAELEMEYSEPLPPVTPKRIYKPRVST